MCTFVAKTLKNSNTVRVQKNICFAEHFRKKRKAPQRWQNAAFFVHEIQNTFSRSGVLFYVLHNIAHITIEQRANGVNGCP